MFLHVGAQDEDGYCSCSTGRIGFARVRIGVGRTVGQYWTADKRNGES